MKRILRWCEMIGWAGCWLLLIPFTFRAIVDVLIVVALWTVMTHRMREWNRITR